MSRIPSSSTMYRGKPTMPPRRAPTFAIAALAAVVLPTLAAAQPPAERAARATGAAAAIQPAGPRTPKSIAPVDLTGYWVTVISEDWAWRIRTPPKGDVASVTLNREGTRVANTWDPATDGSCLAFGAGALLRMPTRLHVTWQDDLTLKIETDNGQQTRLLKFDALPAAPAPRGGPPVAAGATAAAAAGAPPPAVTSAEAAALRAAASGGGTALAPRSLQGQSRAEWQIANIARGSGADSGVVSTLLDESRWAALKVTTTSLSAAWLRPNGVPYSEDAVVTEYFDAYVDGSELWFTVTTIVDDPKYLTEPFVTSSNFKREANAAKWKPAPCKS